MSHYAQLAVQFQQKNETELVDALKTLYGKDGVEVHPEGADLKLYYGQSATESQEASFHAEPCHVIVRKEKLAERKGQTNTPFNDLGYRRNKTGGYTAYVDDAGVPKADIGLIAQEYALKVAEKQLRAKGYSYKRLQLEDQSIRLEATRFR